MKTVTKTKSDQVLSAFVPPAIKDIVKKFAADEDRTTSQIVRRLLEESPRVKAELRKNKAAV